MSSFLDPDDWPEAVVILSKDPFTVAGYGPRITPHHDEPHVVSWREGMHERAFPVLEVFEQGPEVFDFSSGGFRLRLLPLTLQRYETYVRPRTVGRPKFSSMAELLSAMRREW